MIELTDLAKQKLKEIIEDEGLKNQFIRLRIIGGGCAGYSNDMYFETEKQDTDELFEFDEIQIIIDPISYQYLDEVTIDYTDGLIGAGFKFINPKSTGSCGCGNSISF